MVDILAIGVGVVVVLFAGAIVALGGGHIGRNPPEPKDQRPSPHVMPTRPFPPTPPYPYSSYQEAREDGAFGRD